MLLRHICRVDAAQKLEKALVSCAVTVTGDATGATCAHFGDMILKML
jgi:hypothetical protein